MEHWQRLGGLLLDEKVFEFLEEAMDLLFVTRRLQGFKCTAGWLQRWKGRYNVGGTNVSQKVPADQNIISLTHLQHGPNHVPL